MLCLFGSSLAQADGPSFLPFAHLHATTGFSSAQNDSFGALFPGSHDPDEADFSLQEIELGAKIGLHSHLEGFLTARLFLDQSDDPDAELEEAFLTVKDLPGRIGLRGGRFLNQFGLHNTSHLHSWNFIDQNLPHASLLGREGLVTDGAELAISLPTPHPSRLALSYGSPPEHRHGHGHGHGQEHHDEEGHEENGHGEADSEELLELTGDLFTANLSAELAHNDFHLWRATASFATAADNHGNHPELYGIGLAYNWREKGYSPGGRALLLRAEAFFRTGTDTLGATSSAIFQANHHLDLALRADYLEDPGHLRLSPAVTFRPVIASDSNPTSAHLRLQYNYDRPFHARDEHTLLLQLGLGWGSH